MTTTSNTFGTRIPLVLEYLCPDTFGFEYLWVVLRRVGSRTGFDSSTMVSNSSAICAVSVWQTNDRRSVTQVTILDTLTHGHTLIQDCNDKNLSSDKDL